MQRLIETGIRNNTDLNIARLKVKESEALLTASRLAYLPSVSLTPQGTLGSADGAKPTKTYDLAVSADWELDIFGRLDECRRRCHRQPRAVAAFRHRFAGAASVQPRS